MKRFILVPLTWLAAMFFLIEEFIWDQTERLMARLGTLSLIHAIERHIVALPPRWAMFVFLLPSLILISAKFIGLHAIASGHWFFGAAIFVVAKLLGVALFSRIFNLTRPALMQVRWFAGLYNKVMLYLNLIHTYLDQWPAYQMVKKTIKSLIARVKAIMRPV
ncbi:hypothetical protein [Candidatus Nitrotoga sp. AM1P]|uniref:hypothetical protein n=1 Tax=Candidatus Nitrotoga sp. AM1P TaxID=2559597 RepID=UPI0010B1CEBF|nr:hypothetical protein [Candidatus Nitrotoga sp. AM1P]BBJ23128.1 hypothetical protein W01_10550 [Candidatus Nitrotoga sp. AM1P]